MSCTNYSISLNPLPVAAKVDFSLSALIGPRGDFSAALSRAIPSGSRKPKTVNYAANDRIPHNDENNALFSALSIFQAAASC